MCMSQSRQKPTSIEQVSKNIDSEQARRIFETCDQVISMFFVSSRAECDVPVPGFHFFGGIGTGIGKYWYRKKVSEPVSEKFGTGKKSRNRYRKNLVPEKVPVSVSEKIWYRN